MDVARRGKSWACAPERHGADIWRDIWRRLDDICPGVRSKIGERLEQGGVAEIEWDGDMFAAQTSAAQDDEGAGIGQWRHTKKDQWADTKQDRSQEESRSYAFCMHRMHAACMLNVRCMYVARRLELTLHAH